MEFFYPPVFQIPGTSSGFRLGALVAVHVILAAWIKYVVARLPLGTARILASLPVFAVDIVAPWIFDKDTEPLQLFCMIWIVSWLGMFKVLAFCWGRAPLREDTPLTHIAASLVLPLFPKPLSRAKAGPEGRLQDSAGSGLALVSRWMGKTLLLVFVVLSYAEYRESMPLILKHYLLAFTMYAMSGIIMDGPAALAMKALGLQVIPTFDQPWMSASLAEFWGRRWNIPTTSVLRTVCYDPCAEGSLVNPARLRTAPGAKGLAAAAAPADPQQQQQQQPPRPSLLRRQLGLHLAFFVSGVVHEYMAWLLTGANKISWKWTVFFWVQAPLMTLEAYVYRRLRRVGVQLPRWLTIPLTHLVLQALAYDLFFGYMEEVGVSQSIVGAIARIIRVLLRPLQEVVLRGLQRPSDQEL